MTKQHFSNNPCLHACRMHLTPKERYPRAIWSRFRELMRQQKTQRCRRDMSVCAMLLSVSFDTPCGDAPLNTFIDPFSSATKSRFKPTTKRSTYAEKQLSSLGNIFFFGSVDIVSAYARKIRCLNGPKKKLFSHT